MDKNTLKLKQSEKNKKERERLTGIKNQLEYFDQTSIPKSGYSELDKGTYLFKINFRVSGKCWYLSKRGCIS